jgi:hypothetical protein
LLHSFFFLKRDPNKNGKIVDAKQNKKEKKKMNIDLNEEQNFNLEFYKVKKV